MQTCGLILAGGENRRMLGKFKGELTLGKETFLSILVAELKKLTGTIVLSVNDPAIPVPAGCRVVSDLFPGCGPMAGIHAALSQQLCETYLVAACDMPLLRADFYSCLLDGFSAAACRGLPCDGVVPVLHGRPEPLAALYRSTALPVFDGLLRAGSFRVRMALDRLHILYFVLDAPSSKGSFAEDQPACIFPPEQIRAALAPMLLNVNDPQAYRDICNMKPGSKGHDRLCLHESGHDLLTLAS